MGGVDIWANPLINMSSTLHVDELDFCKDKLLFTSREIVHKFLIEL